jgi:hypothetical protein
MCAIVLAGSGLASGIPTGKRKKNICLPCLLPNMLYVQYVHEALVERKHI